MGNLPSARMFEKAQQNCSLGCFCGRSNMIKCRLGVLPVLYKCVILHVGAPLHTAGALLLLLTLKHPEPAGVSNVPLFYFFFLQGICSPAVGPSIPLAASQA